MATGHVPRCVLLIPHRYAGRLHWGKAESIQLCDFADGRSHYRCWSTILRIIRAMCSPSFVLKSARPSQRVNKKPHKVWVAVHTDGTILFSNMIWQCLMAEFLCVCVCDCQIYIKCMNTVVYLVHFKNKKYGLFRQQFWWHWCRFDEKFMTLFCGRK